MKLLGYTLDTRDKFDLGAMIIVTPNIIFAILINMPFMWKVRIGIYYCWRSIFGWH